MKHYCNPINLPYRYQFNMDQRNGGKLQIAREAADPSMICFHGVYYIFASMNLSVWKSEDLVHWESKRLPDNLPLYDYAPDVRVMGDYVYFSASRKGEVCDFYRTKNVEEGPYERIEGSFDFWDPNLFVDEDGRVYFYWGCSNETPIWGVELDPVTMQPKGERKALISGDPFARGYERIGDDNSQFPRSEAEVEMMYQGFLASQPGVQVPEMYVSAIKGMFSNKPFIEGPWMEKYGDTYYLQYACPGTQYNTYGDGVYTAKSPLGPFTLAKNNPFSYHPGGFMPGAGHGSTMWDKSGNFWHTSTMRISVNQQFERRVGIWPAGYDADGELFCNTNYGDWPIAVEDGKMDPFRDPDWYLLSYGKPVTASSHKEGKGPELVTNEDARNWWVAENAEPGAWIQLDLEKTMDVRGIQINFADDHLDIPSPGPIQGAATQPRYIEERDLCTRYLLEGSLDGEHYFVLEDKSKADSDLPHDFVVREDGIQVRFVKLTILQVPYDVCPAISGIRVFGIGTGKKPSVPAYEAGRSEDGLDLLVDVKSTGDAIGYNILWGHDENKLYHSWQVFEPVGREAGKDATKLHQRIGALVQGQEYWVRVDSYNENGITRGKVCKLC